MITCCLAPSGPASTIRPRCGSRSWTVHCLPSSTTTAPGDRSSTAPSGLTAGHWGRPAGRPSCRPAAGTCRRRARSRCQQRRPQCQRIRQRPPLRRHRVHGRQDVVPPPPDDRIPPPARQGELCRRGERLGVLLLDQVPGPDVDQPGTRPRHRQEIGSVHPPLPACPEPEPQRLRHHVGEVPGEIQGQQGPGLFQALEPVMATRADQVLKPGTVTLAAPPGERPDRIGARQRKPHQLPDRPGLRPLAGFPRHQPPVRPSLAKVQPRCSVTGLDRNRQIGPRDAVRPELPAGTLARDTCQQAGLVHGQYGSTRPPGAFAASTNWTRANDLLGAAAR